MGSPFKQLPTLEQVATKTLNIHNELRALEQGMGQVIDAMEADAKSNNDLTAGVLEELTLRVNYIMTMIAVNKPLNSGIADVNGKVQMESKPMLQVYLESGRAKMIAEREAMKEKMREQSLQAERATSGSEADTPFEDANGGPSDYGLDLSKPTTH